MSFQIQVTRRPGDPATAATVVRISGILDAMAKPEADRVLAPLVAAAPKVIVFDLAECTFADSTGMGVVFATRGAIEKKGGRLFITQMQPRVQKGFDVMQALPSTAIFKSVKELDEYLKSIEEKDEDL